MKRQALLMLLTVWLSLSVCATVLVRFQANRRLGRPGVEVVAEPIFNPEGKAAGDHSVYLPARVLNYVSKSSPITDLELDWLPKDTTFGRRLYRAPDGFEVLMSVVLMGTDRTSIHKPQYCLTGQGWTIARSQETSIRIDRPHPYRLPVMELITHGQFKTPAGRRSEAGVYAYWFVADGELTAEHGQRMWWMARDLMTRGVLQRWAYVTCFSVCPPGGEAAAFERMRQFIAAAVPTFQRTTGPPIRVVKPTSAR
jgi:EpsI family protein